MASSRPSFPAPSEPNLKRLGVGGSSTGERPLRAQLVVGSVVLAVLIAVPVYLLRRPSEARPESESEGRLPAKRALIRTALDAGAPAPAITLAPIQRLRCSAAPDREGNEASLCDSLPLLENAFSLAINTTVDCAPKTGKEGSINFVLTVDFTNKKLHVYPGASGQWKGPQAKAAAKCVKAALPEIAWDSISHRYRYYMLGIMATYPAPDPLRGFPEFE